MPTVNTGGASGTRTRTGSYMDAYDQYTDRMNAARDAYRQSVNNQLANDKKTTNTQYDNSARQNYVQYMQNQRALPSQLNAAGVNGGASESAILRAGTAYGNNVATNEASRGTALASLDQNASSTLANYDNSYNENLASAYATALENQIKADKEEQQRNLQNYAASINGRFTTLSEYDAEIARLRKLGVAGDPNANEKIALAQQARSALATQQAETLRSAYSGGGGGGYSYSGGGSSTSSGSTKPTGGKKDNGKGKKDNNKNNTKSTTKVPVIRPWRIWGM